MVAFSLHVGLRAFLARRGYVQREGREMRNDSYNFWLILSFKSLLFGLYNYSVDLKFKPVVHHSTILWTVNPNNAM